jgi:DNA-binding GntR family transcriptional regulator
MQSTGTLTVEFKTREQAAYEALRRAIIQGRWGQGETLVVSHLAAELGVSRITVANALKRLAGEGFVLLTPHKEAAIAPLEPKDVREIYLMRAELEALSAREAALCVTPLDLEELHALNAEIGRLRAQPEPDIRAIRAVDLAFHKRLRQIPAMPHLAHTLENLADQCEAYRARLLDLRQLAMPTAERHLPILAALEAQDASLVAERMRVHVLEGMEAVLAALSRDGSSRPAR